MLPTYKHGKQTTPIDFADFDRAMKEGEFKSYTHKSFLAFLYWFGVRVSEALERTKEDFEINNEVLSVNAPAKKGGERDVPLEVDTDMPYVELIIERWNKTKKGKRLWSFSTWTAQRIVKRALGKKYYPHFLRLNRATEFLDDETTTIPQMKSWFGWKSAQTISSYIGYSKRHVQAMRRRLKRQIEKN